MRKKTNFKLPPLFGKKRSFSNRATVRKFKLNKQTNKALKVYSRLPVRLIKSFFGLHKKKNKLQFSKLT